MPQQDPEPNARRLFVQNGVNPKGEPLLQLILDNRVIAQMTPADARDHARVVTEAAEAAEQDAFMLDFFQKKVGLDFERAGQILLDFRRYRTDTTAKRGGPATPAEWTMPDPTPQA